MKLFLLAAILLLFGSVFASAGYAFTFDNSRLHLGVFNGYGNYAYLSQPYSYNVDGWYFFSNPFRYNFANQYYSYNAGWYNFYPSYYSNPYAFNYYPSNYAYYNSAYYYYPTYNPLARGTTIQIIDPTVSPQRIPKQSFSKRVAEARFGTVPTELFNSTAIVPTQTVDLTDGAESQGSWLVSKSGAFEAEKIPQPSTAPLKEFFVTIGESGYSPNSFTVQQGDLVRFWLLTQKGTESHNHGIAIESYGVDATVSSSTIPTLVEVWATRAGNFSVYCKSCASGSLGSEHPTMVGSFTVQGSNAFPASENFAEQFPDLKPTTSEIAAERTYQKQFVADLQPATVSPTVALNQKVELVLAESQTIFGDGAVPFTVNNFSNSAVTVKVHGNGLSLPKTQFWIPANSVSEKVVLVDAMRVPTSYLVLDYYQNGVRLGSRFITLTSEARLEATPTAPIAVPPSTEPNPPSPAPVDQNVLMPIVQAFGVGFSFLEQNGLAGLIAVLILGVAYAVWGRKSENKLWPGP